MANTYFNYMDPVEPGDRLESTKYNGDFSAIARAFDILPSPDALASNTGNYARSQGTSTAYTVTLPRFDGRFGYITGMQVLLNIHVNNTGAATLNINGLGPKPLVNLTTALGPLVANDLRAGTIYSIRYDGTRFQVVNTVSGAVNASQTAATQATTAATNAGTSATNAANSASAAATSASNAASSASAAASGVTTAANSASAASTSATNAANSASAANTSAGNAASSATAASGSATAAANSATAASGSASTANTRATAAAGSATAAANSATQAAASAQTALNAIGDASFKAAVMGVLLTSTLDVGTVKFYALNIDPNTKYPGTTWVRLPVSQNIRTSNATASDVMTTVGSDTVTLAVANLPSHSHTGTATIANTDLGNKTSTSFDYGTKTSSSKDYGDLTSSSFDYGTKTTSSYDYADATSSAAGGHSHTVPAINGTGTTAKLKSASNDSTSAGNVATSSVGNHTHTFDLPSHNHTVGIGSHTHTVSLGTHSHTVEVGSHTHTVAVGSHNHTVTASIGNTGTGQAFSIVAKSTILVGWRRTA